jgi:DNA polymerase-3 subunit epsilon
MIRRRWADRRRARQLDAVPDGPLHDYLSCPLPRPATPLTRLPLLAVDLETTGLDPARDEILSIGFVPLDGLSIVLAGARQMLVRGAAVGQSATIHGLTDDTVAGGLDLADALAAVLEALRGRVLLAHHAALERDFLGAACRRVYGQSLPCVTVDTMELEHRLLNPGWGQEPPPGSLRLGAARERHGLPRYRSHEALTDALACAELYLAQASELGHGRSLTLRRLT